MQANRRDLMENKPRKQGEGDWESAKRYNEKTQKFVESGKVDEAARKAGKGDKQEMERAEKAGKDRAKEFDPAGSRDYSKPTK
jgi:hypothetical protein